MRDKIFSKSSACLTLILTRTELIDPSIRTFSVGLRLTTTGVSRSSLFALRQFIIKKLQSTKQTVNLDSTSGLLCLSTFCEAKFSKHTAAVNVARTADRYGFNVFDYIHYLEISPRRFDKNLVARTISTTTKTTTIGLDAGCCFSFCRTRRI